MKQKLYMVSLGCTKNLIDTEVMLSRLSEYELCDDIASSDVIVVNTCGFIESAKEESLQTIMELHTQRKQDSLLVMAGCLSQRYKDVLQKELVEVDIFTGVGDYDHIDRLIKEKKSQYSDRVFLMSDLDNRVISNSSYHAYIKLSEGCNQKCSFCAIPNFKGKLLSRTLESIRKELEVLVSKGFYDFSFVSQDSSSFLRDHGINNGLEQLINMVETIPGVKSARILYLYPSTTTKALIQTIAESEVFHSYFDMPLQHITPTMLKVMRRGKGSEQLQELLEAMKNIKGSFVRSTFIVGHPQESQQDFDDLCEFVREYGFDRANVFSYSDEEDTHAYEMQGKIPQEIIDQRAQILGDIIANSTEKSLKSEIQSTIEVVIEGESSEHEYLLSAKKLSWAPEIDGEIYINENLTEHKLEFGKTYKAKVTQLVGEKLLATIVH